MTKNEIDNIMRVISDLDERIESYKMDVKTAIDGAENWNGAETASAYATRLNGFISERRGMYAVLNLLHCELEFDKDNHLVKICEKE